MAFSSTSQQAHMIIKSGKSMTIKHKKLDINQNDIKLLVEQIVDFDSFNQNRFDPWSYFGVQEWSSYFDMLNGPTYPYLVKDFCVRAEFFDEFVASVELSLLVHNDSSLKWKSGEEVGLKKFEEVEIGSAMMDVDVVITQKTIAKLLKVPNSRRFILNTKENSHEA